MWFVKRSTYSAPLLGSRSYSTYRFNMHQSVLSDIIEGASEDETIQRINAAKLTFPPNMRAVVLKPSYFRGNEYLYDVLTPGTTLLLTDLPAVRPDPSTAAMQPLLESEPATPAVDAAGR